MSKRVKIKFPLRAVGILILSLLLTSIVAPVIPSSFFSIEIPIVRAYEGEFINSWDTSAESNDPYGITTDGTNIWILDFADNKVYKYTMAGVYIDSWNTAPSVGADGITTDGANIWIVDWSDEEVYKYTMAGVYTTEHWNTGVEGHDPYGMTTDGTNIWIVDEGNDEVYKYNMAGGYIDSWDISGQSDDGHGVTTDGANIWIVDWSDKEVYKYTMAGVYTTEHWDVSGQSDNPQGIATDGNFIWILDTTDNEVYQYEYVQRTIYTRTYESCQSSTYTETITEESTTTTITETSSCATTSTTISETTTSCTTESTSFGTTSTAYSDWLDGWGYRKSHNITGSSGGAQTNYVVKIKVYFGAGVDGTEAYMGDTIGKVYCDSTCQVDFDDIRLTTSDGNTLIDHWLKEKVNSDYAIFEVEVPSIPADPDDALIFIYWGNVGAASASNIYNTYGVYIGDDFEECDLGRWDDDDVGVGVSDCTDTVVFERGYAWRGYDGVDAGGVAQSSKTITGTSYLAAEVAVRVGTVQPNEKNTVQFFLSLGAANRMRLRAQYIKNNDEVKVEYHTGIAWTDMVTSLDEETWYQLKIYWKDTTFDVYVYDATGALLGFGIGLTGEGTGNVDDVLLRQTCTTGGSGYSYQDIVRVRKYVSPEPGHGVWGAEETSGTTATSCTTMTVCETTTSCSTTTTSTISPYTETSVSTSTSESTETDTETSTTTAITHWTVIQKIVDPLTSITLTSETATIFTSSTSTSVTTTCTTSCETITDSSTYSSTSSTTTCDTSVDSSTSSTTTCTSSTDSSTSSTTTCETSTYTSTSSTTTCDTSISSSTTCTSSTDSSTSSTTTCTSSTDSSTSSTTTCTSTCSTTCSSTSTSTTTCITSISSSETTSTVIHTVVYDACVIDEFNNDALVAWYNNTQRDASGWVEVMAAPSHGQVWSTNMLDDLNVTQIVYFRYNLTMPGGAGAWAIMQFSQDNATWVDSGGIAQWEDMTDGDNTILLTGLDWAGNFYYRIWMQEDDGDASPELDLAQVCYSTIPAGGGPWNFITIITMILVMFGVLVVMRSRRR